MQRASYDLMQPKVVLALQKMVEVEVDNLVRLCGLVVSLQLDTY